VGDFVEEKTQRDRGGQFLQTIFAHPVFIAGMGEEPGHTKPVSVGSPPPNAAPVPATGE